MADFGVDGFRFHFLRHAPFRPDGDVSYEGITAGYNSDLANSFGNLLRPGRDGGGQKCGGVGPAPRADSPLASVAADAYRDACGCVGRRRSLGALEATWRLIREATRCSRRRALEGGAGPRGRQGPGRRARGAAAGVHPGQPGAHPCHQSRGSASASPDRQRSSDCPRRPRGAATPAVWPWRGDPLFPASRPEPGTSCAGPTTTATCTSAAMAAAPTWTPRRSRRRGVRGRRRSPMLVTSACSG
ncbi:MAG: hypothetical protein R2701_08935 [Acidimicrobiales bacterium]